MRSFAVNHRISMMGRIAIVHFSRVTVLSRVFYVHRTCACFKAHGVGFSRKKTERENDSWLRVSARHSHCTHRRRRCRRQYFHHIFPHPYFCKRRGASWLYYYTTKKSLFPKKKRIFLDSFLVF